MKIIAPLFIYHFVFFPVSMGWFGFTEGEGSELFVGMLWFHFTGVLLFLNLFTYYFYESFLTIDLFSWNTDGDEIIFPLVMHLVFVVAIGFSQFVAVALRLRTVSRQKPMDD